MKLELRHRTQPCILAAPATGSVLCHRRHLVDWDAETPPPARPPLPPSESDLDLLKSTKLCDSRQTFHEAHPGITPHVQAWGSGEELRIPQEQSLSKSEESYFFDEDGTLVGTLIRLPIRTRSGALQNSSTHPVSTQTQPRILSHSCAVSRSSKHGGQYSLRHGR